MSRFSLSVIYSTLKFISLLLSISFFINSCVPTKRIPKETQVEIREKNSIRVLLEESKEMKITLDNEAILIFNLSEKITLNKNSHLTFFLEEDGLKCKIGRKTLSSDNFILESKNGKVISFNRKSYRGFLRIVKNSSQIYLINILNIEDYVKGVVLKEMPLGNGEGNFEALKAFSILSRTYAMKKVNEEKKFFDTYADVRDQVYGGVNSENEITNKLVDLTKGQVLFYNDKIATIFYHSTCGGITENVENVFKSEPLPYLTSKKDGSSANCKISPRYEWQETFSESLIIKRLIESNYISDKNSKLRDIKIISRFNSGRVNELKITIVEKNKLKEISLFSNNIRFILRTSKGSILPSTNFEIYKTNNEDFFFKGIGFGHGVGMCQWGSIHLSRSGWNYKEIIDFYFPKTRIKKVYD